MKKSKANSVSLHDFLEVLKNFAYIATTTFIASVLEANKSGEINKETIRSGIIIGIFTGLLVFIERFLKDNTK